MQKTDRNGLCKSGDAIVSTDSNALAAYRKQRAKLRTISSLEEEIKQLKNRVAILEGKI
jgi:hypothetical protein